jgi:imidazolonepropionase-like amidohydrolase
MPFSAYRALALCCLLTLSALTTVSRAQTRPQAPRITRYDNARWWNGESFDTGSRFVQNGRFVTRTNLVADTIIDLDGRFVIPPLGDAHMHGFDNAAQVPALAQRYLTDGVFYIASLGNSASGIEAARAAVARHGGIEVLHANGMITSPGGHPTLSYEAQAAGKQQWSVTAEERQAFRDHPTLEGDVYWTARDSADVARFWPRYLQQSPDIVKVIIMGEEGLSRPALAEAVRRARLAARPVFAHVQTADDLRLALDVGVDVLAHMPDYNRPVDTLPEELLGKLVQSGIPVTPTFARELAMEPFVPEAYRKRATLVDSVRASHGARLLQLQRAGVPLLAGFDLNDRTALDELIYWQQVSQLPGATILNSGTRVTPRTLLPGRSVGCLTDGCEASFLAMREHPAVDISAVRRADVRVREGRVITAETSPPPDARPVERALPPRPN